MLSRIALSFLLMICIAATAQGDVGENVTGSVTGRITDTHGSPLAVMVQLFSYNGDGYVYQILSDKQGLYSFNNIPSGQYILRVYWEGRTFVKYSVNRIIVAAPETTSDVDAVLDDN